MQLEAPHNYTIQSLSDIAVNYIKNKILSGEFKSGDKLVESDISAELQISRAPVREAMRELSVEGMILFSPRRGNYVRDMTLDETLEVFDIRVSLEKRILELLVQNQMLTEENFAELQALVDAMQDREASPPEEGAMIYQLNLLDLQFHSALWKASKSFQRGKILEGLFFQLLIAMNRDTLTLGNFQDKAAEHGRILAALRRNDLAGALGEFEDHIGVYVQAISTEMLKG